jgi:hypothetical protein
MHIILKILVLGQHVLTLIFAIVQVKVHVKDKDITV